MNFRKRIGAVIALAFAATTLAVVSASALSQSPAYSNLAGVVGNCP
ncbi:hypothetical protein ACFV0O_40740 [Kitasatospora sp. NPDC059577]